MKLRCCTCLTYQINSQTWIEPFYRQSPKLVSGPAGAYAGAGKTMLTLWCRIWGCRNKLINGAFPVQCAKCGALTCPEHVGLHWEKVHGPRAMMHLLN